MNFCGQADYIHTQNDLQSRNNQYQYSRLQYNQDQYQNQSDISRDQRVQFNIPQSIQQKQIFALDKNQKKQIKKLSMLQRNQKIAALLTVAIAFSQKIEQIKQKICGYPSYSFMPQKYYEMLDLSDKNFVDIQDVKQFVNNPKVRDKDVCALFKRMNSDINVKSTKLTYLGYLNMIKPTMNQQLARDLLLRDTVSKYKRGSKATDNTSFSQTLLQPTQQSILLLFQQLMLLHCISSTEHQTAKQLLMEEYMLNTKQIAQILGLFNQRKGCLTILWQFITKNSQFEVSLSQMKYLLSFSRGHQFSLKSQKCLAQLFLPSNVNQQLMRTQKNQTTQLIADISSDNHYYNTYLRKQNLLSTQNNNIVNFMQKKATLQNDFGISKANFLQFVHPQSIKRLDNVYKPKQDNIKIEQKNVQVLINPTNNSYNNIKNSSYFMKDRHSQKYNQQVIQNVSKRVTVKENVSKSRLQQNDFRYNSGVSVNGGVITPLLQQFMKESNIKRNMGQNNTKKSALDNQRMNNYYSKPHHYEGDASLINSQSAFEVVDYAYDGVNSANKPKNSYVINNAKKQKPKQKGLQSRYNMVISQYHNNNNKETNSNKDSFNQYQNHKHQEHSVNPIIQNNHKKYNYINSVGMSHSKIVPNESFANSGILDAFIKHY